MSELVVVAAITSAGSLLSAITVALIMRPVVAKTVEQHTKKALTEVVKSVAKIALSGDKPKEN